MWKDTKYFYNYDNSNLKLKGRHYFLLTRMIRIKAKVSNTKYWIVASRTIIHFLWQCKWYNHFEEIFAVSYKVKHTFPSNSSPK